MPISLPITLRAVLAASLAVVCGTETKLLDTDRVQACNILDYGLRSAQHAAVLYELAIAISSHMERGGHWTIWEQLLLRTINLAHQSGEEGDEIPLTALLGRL